MNEMIGYVFGGLHNSERAINAILRNQRAQSKFNKSVVTFAFVTVFALHAQQVRIDMQNKKIEALSKELEDLKGSMKGEQKCD